jgi:hypothetical protein
MSQGISDKELSEFEDKLTETGYFWQSESGNIIEYLFYKNNTIVCITNGRLDDKTVGRWSFDKSTKTLEIAWYGGTQFSSSIESVKDNWATLIFSKEFHEYGDEIIRRLKLIDDRFDD